MARRLPKPFEFRSGWRAQVTLKNGDRPHIDCETHAEAKAWIVETLANANSSHEPAVGGPRQARLADALRFYAEHYTITKDGAVSELNRINHYLAGAGMPLVRATPDDKGVLQLQEYTPKAQPKAWQQHNDHRRALRAATYATIHELARKRCNAISKIDIRRLMTTMTTDGLSDSTIQKEIALLRAMFNSAVKEWQWCGFENPAQGLKLGSSKQRFVHLTKEQERRLWQAVLECDNPYVAPLIACCRETTLRRKSLLTMDWSKVDLQGRVVHVRTKTGDMRIPLSQHAVSVLENVPRDSSGRVFPMTANAVDLAWEGIREKAGIPTLQFRDLRHLGGTDWARRGLNAHELKEVLGHKSTRMAENYVNLVALDVLSAMDATAPENPVFEVPPPAAGTAREAIRGRRSMRLALAVKNRADARRALEDRAGPEARPDEPASTDATGTDAAPSCAPATLAASAEACFAKPPASVLSRESTYQAGQSSCEPTTASAAPGESDQRPQANNVIPFARRRVA